MQKRLTIYGEGVVDSHLALAISLISRHVLARAYFKRHVSLYMGLHWLLMSPT